MNFVFWGIVAAALVFIWFCLSFAFKGFGKFWLRLFHDAVDAINDDPKEKGENK